MIFFNLTKLESHTDCVNTVCFSPDGKELASGASDTKILIWSTNSWKVRRVLTGHDEDVLSV